MLFGKNDLRSIEEPPVERDEGLENFCYWTRYFVHVWATSIYAFTRRNFGREYFGPLEMTALLLMSGWAVVTAGPQEAGHLTVLMTSFLALSLWHRQRSREVLHDNPPHSHYAGRPWICDLLKVREGFAKSILEPGAVAMMGWAMIDVSSSVGWFFIIGAIACFLDWVYLTNRDSVRARRIRNAEKEQERVAAAYDRMFNR